MATVILQADSLDSYANTTEMTSSGRWWYLPSGANTTISTGTLVPGAGRYGGNALCMQTLVTGNSSEYFTNAVAPINVPALTPINGQSSKTWSNLSGTGIAFAFWFRASVPTNEAATVNLIMTSGYSTGGSSNTVLGPTSNLSTNPWLTISHAAGNTTPTTVTLYAVAYPSPVVSGACPVDVLDGNWHWIELGVVFNNALGSGNTGGPNEFIPSGGFGSSWCTCYIDQNLIFTNSNLSTVGTISPADGFQGTVAGFFFPHFGTTVTTGTGQGFFYDDVIVLNNFTNGWPLGPRRIACMRPNADGNTINFTPEGTATDNYQAVSVGYTNTGSYVQSTGYNQIDLYKFPALSYVPQNVNAVITNIQAGNFENGTTIGMEPLMNDGTNPTVTGVRTTLPTMKYGPIQTIYMTDGGGNTWVDSEINSIQVGFETVQ